MFAQNSAQNIQIIMLDDIRRDGGTQPRVAIDWKHVKLLEGQMSEGDKLEPVIVFMTVNFTGLLMVFIDGTLTAIIPRIRLLVLFMKVPDEKLYFTRLGQTQIINLLCHAVGKINDER